MAQPDKIPAAFASSGDRNIIPQSTEQIGLASWAEGFPAICSQPFAEGGVAPKRADFNGIFNALSRAIMWYQQGGVFVYDTDTDYETGNVVLDLGALYIATGANGPSSSLKRPSEDLTGTNWQEIMTRKQVFVPFTSTWYKRPSLMTPNRTSVTIPGGMQVAINGGLYITQSAKTILLDAYVTAANRAGKDVYVYACVPSSGTEPDFVLSLNSTVPTGYTSSNSRKIGGFHCLCLAVGTISDHTLSGYNTGDILPASVWDLLFRAESENEGMVFVGGHWYDIYLPSWSSNKLQSVYGETIVDGTSSMPMHGERFAEYAGLVSKRLIKRDEFVVVAKGSNEQTNITGSVDPNTTGGHKDTANRRMISNYGLEDCCGVQWQWTSDVWGTYNSLSTTSPATFSNQGGINATAMDQSTNTQGNHYLNAYVWQSDGRGTSNYLIDGSASLYGNAYGTFVRALAGGRWGDGSSCGSRSVDLSGLSSCRYASSSGRLASEPRVVNL